MSFKGTCYFDGFFNDMEQKWFLASSKMQVLWWCYGVEAQFDFTQQKKKDKYFNPFVNELWLI